MASVNFNAAATSALRNLQNTNSALDATQNRISTGLKIGEAKDNAAYWSISTTMKSDNEALSTVSDALGLGAATVDTAYEGLNSTLDVLNEIKSKLTSASQDGVDKKAIQSEIAELQTQLKSIASASTFSGENWLSVNSGVDGYSADKSIVSSFNRSASGAVTLATINIDTSSLVLIDGSSTKEGILDAGKVGNATLKGGLAGDTAISGEYTAAVADAKSTRAAGTFVGADIEDTKKISFTLAVGTTSQAIEITGTTAMAGDADGSTFKDAIQTAIDDASSDIAGMVTVSVDATTGAIVFTAVDNGPDAITLSGLSTDGTSGKVGGLVTTGTSTPGATAADAEAATVTMTASFAAFELDANDTVSFDIAVDGVTTKVAFDKSTVDSALGTTDGKIATEADYAKVLTQALKDANVSGVTVSDDGSNKMVFTAATSIKELSISGATASSGVSVLTMDVTTADAKTLTGYINSLSAAIDKVTSAASTLGAVSARIDLQSDFVTKLMDTIDQGVSGLVDADMNEESTKLQALQVKQQLGVQALSIANQSAQNVLALFQ